MFAIQSIMLVSLGFLLAVLLGFVFAPAYWARAARLTSERLRHSMPMSEAEIRADGDRLRAQHAIRIHKLKTLAETANLSVARQKVEINRRDAAISELEKTVSGLEADLETSKNARRVLEQTIMDRVPRVEKKLVEARDLLSKRDREMVLLEAKSTKTFHALDEAMQINRQQRLEIDRLQSLLATRQSRIAMDRINQTAFDGDVALRSELEVLRARTREQASLIANLQGLLRDNIDGTDAQVEQKRAALEAGLRQIDAGMQSAQKILTTAATHDADADADADAVAVAQNANALRELKAKIETQESEIEKLRAVLEVYEEGESVQKSFSLRDVRIALKARIASLEKETAMQTETIRKLRAELASTNDRSARQAAHHLNELRRLGAGTFQTTISARQRAEARNEAEQAQRRRSLSERIQEKVPASSADFARSPQHQHYKSQPERLLTSAGNKAPQLRDERAEPSLDANNASAIEKVAEAQTVHTEVKEKNKSSKRGKLFERIAGVSKR